MPVVAVLAWSIVLMIVVNDILRSLENYNIPSEKEHLDARDCVSLSFLPFLDVFTWVFKVQPVLYETVSQWEESTQKTISKKY